MIALTTRTEHGLISLRDLERHLPAHGCALAREGGRHSIWENLQVGRRSSVPRHRELPLSTTRAVCDQLGVPRLR